MKKTISLLLALVMCLSLCACGSGPETKTVKATVVTNSGETKQMTLAEIKGVVESNSLLFEKEYVGADITVTSTITKIGGAFLLTSWFECEAYLELDASDNAGCWFKPVTEDYALTLSVGDEITVSGKIGMASATGFDVYILYDKISPYGNESSQPTEIITQPTSVTTFMSITLGDESTANHILELWRAGEATDDSMKALMDEYGADQGGGILYEYEPDVFLKEVADWVVDPSRKVGDVEILKTEYGYNIVYIVSLGNG